MGLMEKTLETGVAVFGVAQYLPTPSVQAAQVAESFMPQPVVSFLTSGTHVLAVQFMATTAKLENSMV
jgi:hypothetical protein